LLLFALIASFCHFFGAFVVLNSAEMSAPHVDLEGGRNIGRKDAKRQKKQMFGTELNLALALHLV